MQLHVVREAMLALTQPGKLEQVCKMERPVLMYETPSSHTHIFSLDSSAPHRIL